MICKKCGLKIDDNVKFCSNCGWKIKGKKEKNKKNSKNEKKSIIKIIVITLIIIILGLGSYLIYKKISNPYNVTKDFDGSYKFSEEFTDETEPGTSIKVIATGILKLEKGKCKIKYVTIKKNETLTTSITKEYKGVCGTKGKDNSKVYLKVNCSDYDCFAEYICSVDGMNLLGEVKENSQKLPLIKKVEKITFEHISDEIEIETVFKKLINDAKTLKNPYEENHEFDGIYKFENEYGNTGLISLKEGNCLIEYDEKNEKSHVLKGFCGIKEGDNSTLYISIYDKDNSSVTEEYKCTIDGKNLICENIGDYSSLFMNNEKIKFAFYSNLSMDEVREQVFKENCSVLTFEELARNPEKIKGTKVKLTGEVVQEIYGTYSNSYRVNITKTGTYSTYYEDTIYVNYIPQKGEDKILEDDIITIWGTAEGDYSYTSTMGAEITLPLINAKYIERN